jgi:dTDP-4-amino-4,6-dideoxygalactose transaminase
MKWKLSLCEPDIGKKEIDAVVGVLKSKWLTMGAVTGSFEKMFADKLGIKHSFAVTNCTAALHLANLALDIGPGDEVICPALTFVATANATMYTGGRVVFAKSVSQDDLTIDPEDIESKITPRTKAISVVHYAGFPCHMEAILKVAKKHNLRIIEDCAHSPLAWTMVGTKRKYTGTIGDVGCFSFFSNKNMTTGEGGMVVTNNDEMAAKIKLLRSHGMTSLTYDRHKGHATGYDVVMLGYNYRMDEIRSAIGIVQLEKLEKLNQTRRSLFQNYRDIFSESKLIRIPFSKRNLEESSCHIMPVIVKGKYLEIKEQLLKNRIQVSKHYDPIPTFRLYKKSIKKYHVDEFQIMTLPLGPTLKKTDIAYIKNVIDKI